MSDSGAVSGVRWRYRAADANGRASSGEIDAGSERDAVDALRRRELWVTELSPLSGSATVPRPWSRASGAGVTEATTRWGLPDWLDVGSASGEFAVVMRAVATLLSAGVPLDRALAYAAAQAPITTQRDAFAAVRASVRGGASLSSAVAQQSVFPKIFAPTIAASEASGTLDATLTMLADRLDRDAAMRTRLASALIYPTILAVASAVGVTVILLVVVPRFAALIADGGGSLPMSTRLLVALSNGVARGWWLLLIAAALGIALGQQWLRDPERRRQWHAQRLSWPILGRLERLRNAARYADTLSVALRSGVSLLGAMSLARGLIGNQAMAAAMAAAESRVRDGASLAGTLEGTLPPIAVRLLDAGEVSGELAEMAHRAATAADADVQRAIGRAMALIEPVMILGFGGIVGFVALALLQAIYGINARSF